MMMMQSNMIGATDFKAQNKQLSVPKVSDTGLMVPSISVEQGTKPSVTNTSSAVPALLLELVTIVSQIAQLDAMFDKVKESAPDAGSEADKWHQVSVQALETSRKYMVEQQTSLIQRLATNTGTSLPAQSGNVALEPRKEDALVATKKVVAIASPPGLAPPPGLENMVHNDEQANSPPSPKSQVSGEGNSLRTDLEKIKLHAPGCALLVRKIKPLGFESAEHLKTYFEQFGTVAEVLVSHCITKPSPKRATGRVRPAALGFVVMASPEEADKAFAHGEHHFVQGKDASVGVEVTRFRDGSEDNL